MMNQLLVRKLKKKIRIRRVRRKRKRIKRKTKRKKRRLQRSKNLLIRMLRMISSLKEAVKMALKTLMEKDGSSRMMTLILLKRKSKKFKFNSKSNNRFLSKLFDLLRASHLKSSK